MAWGFCVCLLTYALLQPLSANANQLYFRSHDPTGPAIIPVEGSAETSSEIFFHPTIRIIGEYTDNLYNLNHDQQSNFLTTITPGFWLTMGQAQTMPEEIISRNTAPGGIVISPLRVEGYHWINASLSGSMNFNYYSENSENNYIGGNLNGRVEYKPSSKLAIYLEDQFNRKQVAFDAGNSLPNSKRWSDGNIIYTGLDWDITEKFSTGLNFSNFFLLYNDNLDDYMDRTDNGLHWYGAYRYSEKTRFSLGVRYMDLSYDSATYQDNKQHFIYGGLDWAGSVKTTLRLKAGFQQRQYKNDLISVADKSDEATFAFGLGLDYQATDKTSLSFVVSNRLEESDSSVALGKQVFTGSIGYRQQLTRRLYASLGLSYSNEDYNQIIGPVRKDDVLLFKPALQYVFRQWLMAEIAYSYEDRNSTDHFFEYETNTFFLSLNSAW